MKNISSYLFLFLVLLTGCATYNPSVLCDLPQDVIKKGTTKEGVTIAASALTQREVKRFLDRDVLVKGYQPVQLYIENDSSKGYLFSTSRVGLSLAPSEEVAEKVHTSTLGRVAGYGALSIVAAPIFLIPAAVDGYKSLKANDQLDEDFARKAAKDQRILPHSHVNMLLFVPMDLYRSTFTLTLLDEKSGKPRNFNITIR